MLLPAEFRRSWMRFYQETMKLPFLRDISDLTPVPSSPATTTSVLCLNICAGDLSNHSPAQTAPLTGIFFRKKSWKPAFPQVYSPFKPPLFYPIWDQTGTWNFSVSQRSCVPFVILLQLHYLVVLNRVLFQKCFDTITCVSFSWDNESIQLAQSWIPQETGKTVWCMILL